MTMLKLLVEEAKMSVSDMNLDTIAARLQGAAGVTYGNEHTSTRTTEGNIFGIVLPRKLTKGETVPGTV